MNPSSSSHREFDINRPWEHFRQKLDAEAARNTDRTQFGLAQNQVA